MYAAFSTSSPLISVAIFGNDFSLIDSLEVHAPMQGNTLVLGIFRELFDRNRIEISEIDGYLADLGPGSFTGVKIAVTVAKTLGYINQKKVGGVMSHQLISGNDAVAVPIKKGQYVVRLNSSEIKVVDGLPADVRLGYGSDFDVQSYPHAKNFEGLISAVDYCDPVRLLPQYILEPSISTPKKRIQL